MLKQTTIDKLNEAMKKIGDGQTEYCSKLDNYDGRVYQVVQYTKCTFTLIMILDGVTSCVFGWKNKKALMDYAYGKNR